MKKTYNLNVCNSTMLRVLLCERAYDVYLNSDPICIFYDVCSCTFSVRGFWEVDGLTLLELNRGLVCFAVREDEED